MPSSCLSSESGGASSPGQRGRVCMAQPKGHGWRGIRPTVRPRRGRGRVVRSSSIEDENACGLFFFGVESSLSDRIRTDGRTAGAGAGGTDPRTLNKKMKMARSGRNFVTTTTMPASPQSHPLIGWTCCWTCSSWIHVHVLLPLIPHYADAAARHDASAKSWVLVTCSCYLVYHVDMTSQVAMH